MKTVCIVPTYNEAENILHVIDEIRSLAIHIDILVVDDNSPDGTSNIVKERMKIDTSLYIIQREAKLGLGTAYIEGFKWALDKGYELIMEMDADLSHNPKEIPNFINAIDEADLVVGSRYLNGFNVVNWPLRRLILSYGANIYSRLITGLPLKDATGGFKCFHRNVLQSIDLDKVKSGGYSFQIEMSFLAWKKGFRLKEIPIIFVDRTDGKSKMSYSIVLEAVFIVWKLKFLSIFYKDNTEPKNKLI